MGKWFKMICKEDICVNCGKKIEFNVKDLIKEIDQTTVHLCYMVTTLKEMLKEERIV